MDLQTGQQFDVPEVNLPLNDQFSNHSDYGADSSEISFKRFSIDLVPDLKETLPIPTNFGSDTTSSFEIDSSYVNDNGFRETEL